MTHSITTRWENDFHFISSQDNKEIHFDATALPGDHDLGVSPKTILLSALSGCTGMDVVALLNKKFKVSFSRFDITVSGALTDTHPIYYDKIHILYTIDVADTDKEKVNEAVHLSLTKYCGVHEMLSKAAAITHEVKFL